MATRLIVKGAEIVTMDERLGDAREADILIEDGRLIAIGPGLGGSDAEVIDGRDCIVLPGIIDTHNCLWQTVLRGAVPDLWPGTYFTEFLPLRSRFRPEDNFNAAYIGAFEMLSYGTTTVVDYCHNVRGPGYADASIRALQETGIRHVFSYSFMSAEPDGFENPEDRFADARRIHGLFHDPAGLTTINFGVVSPGSPGLEAQIAFARSLGAPSCIHLHQAGAVAALDARGLIGPDLMVIHGNQLTNAELDRMAVVGMPICFTPSADVQGTPADVVRRAADRGVPVVFGCDVPCHVASDPIGQLRIMFNVQGFIDGAMARSFGSVAGRRPPVGPDMPLLTPRRLLQMATIGAARVLGLDDRIGSLTVGKRADLVMVRKGPFGSSVTGDPCAHVLLQTSPRDIDTVIVDGRVRMRGGQLKDFDAARASAMLAASRRQILG